jgi:hypothetical protein
MSYARVNEPPKPWSVTEFQRYRPSITRFVDDSLSPLIDKFEIKRICIHGDVKSGKREIVEYTARKDEGSLRREHVFISSFHRVSDESQREELSTHNIKVYSITNENTCNEAILYISHKRDENKQIILHLDECDYGTGVKQNLKKIYDCFKTSQSIVLILYSATPEELIFSEDITQNEDDDNFIQEIYEVGVRLYYIPPDTYCGAKQFLDANLVLDAKPFIEKNNKTYTLSSQANEIMSDLNQHIQDKLMQKRRLIYLSEKNKEEGNVEESSQYEEMINKKINNILVLRLTGGSRDTRLMDTFLKNVHLIQELENVTIIVDKPSNYKKKSHKSSNIICEQIQWSTKEYWDTKTDNKIIMFVHEQTSTRSTEWACHDRIFATHDYRDIINYGTVAQAQLRASHYITKYGSFQQIRIYGHKKTFLFAAKRMTITCYLNDDWEKCETLKNSKKFLIKNVNDNTTHPVYNVEYDKEKTLQILKELNIPTEISSRVRGTSKTILKINAIFIQCDYINVNDKIREKIGDLPEEVKQHNFQTNKLFDDFDIIQQNGETIKKYKGTLRSVKDIYEFNFIKDQRWGFNKRYTNPRITVCYHNENLGICLRYTTGETEEVNTLTSYLSMYQPIR